MSSSANESDRSMPPPPGTRSSINEILNPKYKSPAPKTSNSNPNTHTGSSSGATNQPTALAAHFHALKEKLKLPDIITPPRSASIHHISIPSPTISVTSPYAMKGNQSPSYVKPIDNSISSIAAAAQATPYKPFQTMTDPNFIQLLVAFSKAPSASQAQFLDDNEDQNNDSPTSIDARVQQRLIQWGLAQKNAYLPNVHSKLHSFPNVSNPAAQRGNISPNVLSSNQVFQVPAPATQKLAAMRIAQLTKQLDEKKLHEKQLQLSTQSNQPQTNQAPSPPSDNNPSLQSPTSSMLAQALLGLEKSTPATYENSNTMDTDNINSIGTDIVNAFVSPVRPVKPPSVLESPTVAQPLTPHTNNQQNNPQTMNSDLSTPATIGQKRPVTPDTDNSNNSPHSNESNQLQQLISPTKRQKSEEQ
jgi:hypothetical protein